MKFDFFGILNKKKSIVDHFGSIFDTSMVRWKIDRWGIVRVAWNTQTGPISSNFDAFCLVFFILDKTSFVVDF